MHGQILFPNSLIVTLFTLTLIHTVRAIMEDPDTHPDLRCVLKVDLINAFNRVNRATALQEIREHFPEVARWL